MNYTAYSLTAEITRILNRAEQVLTKLGSPNNHGVTIVELDNGTIHANDRSMIIVYRSKDKGFIPVITITDGVLYQLEFCSTWVDEFIYSCDRKLKEKE